MTIQAGERLPDVPITIATADGPKPTTTNEFFSGKKVALFAVLSKLALAFQAGAQGGHQVEFEDQDPRIHKLWLEEMKKAGVTPRMDKYAIPA